MRITSGQVRDAMADKSRRSSPNTETASISPSRNDLPAAGATGRDPAAGHDDRRIRLRRRCRHPGRPAHVRDARRARSGRRHRGDGAELVGRQGLSRDPAGRHRRPDRGRRLRHRHPGRQDRHAGVVGDHRHGRRDLASRVWQAPCRWSSTRCARRCTAIRCCTRARWIRFRGELFPLATLVTPNLDEVRLLVDIEVVDDESQRDAARALHALGPQWALVKGGHLRSSSHSPDLLFDGTDFYEFDADAHRHRPRPRRRRHAGRRGRRARSPTATPCPTRSRSGSGGSPNVCAPHTRWATATARCRRCSGSSSMNLDADRGHRPRAQVRRTAPGHRRADPRRRRQPRIAAADEDLRRVGRAAAGSRCATTCRIGGAGRRARRPDPPTADQAGIVEAIELAHTLADGPGHRGRPLLRRADDLDGGRRRGCATWTC